MYTREGNERKGRVNVDHAIERIQILARINRFDCEPFGYADGQPLFALHRKANTTAAPTVYLSAGIHGDEPAGPLAILHLLGKKKLPEAINWWIFPLLNPSGFARGQRENAHGQDLNRAYHFPPGHEATAEVGAHKAYLNKHCTQIDLALYLHEDWEAEGAYLYELNFADSPSLAQPILRSIQPQIAIEQAEEVDGHTVHRGIIKPETVPENPEGLPESIYIYQRFGLSRSYTIETPSSLPVATRMEALGAAVLAATRSMGTSPPA